MPGHVEWWAGESLISCAPSWSPTPYGLLAATPARRHNRSQRPRIDILLLGILSTTPPYWPDRLHGLRQRRTRQRRRREFLRVTVMRNPRPARLANLRRRRLRDVPLDRSLLQPDLPTLCGRLPQPHRPRSHRSGMIPKPIRL